MTLSGLAFDFFLFLQLLPPGVRPEVQALPVGDSVVAGHFERGRAGSQGQAQGLPIHAEAGAFPAAAVLGDIAELQLAQRNFRGVHLSMG